MTIENENVEAKTDMRRLTTGIRSGKCVVRQFRRCANVIVCSYTNLDSKAYYTPSLYRNKHINIYIYIYPISGPGSSVGIATDYGLNGPGSNPDGDEIFLPSRPALEPTQPPVQWVPGLSRG